MSLKLLRCRNLRTFAEVEFEPCQGLNLITGRNGSGKTTLLEAIHLLFVGKSFRSHQISPLIKRGEQSLLLFGESQNNYTVHRIGIEKSENRKHRIRLDGQNITRLSQLARIQPVKLLTPESHKILEMESAYRRKFIEWGLFHVEQHYFTLLSRYKRVLSQRNSILKHRATPDRAWDHQFVELSLEINAKRQTYVKKLADNFSKHAYALNLDVIPDLVWYCGWSDKGSLEEQLQRHLEIDMKQGFTYLGPHRADLKFRVAGKPASKILSRGQQKIVLFALTLAQTFLHLDESENRPILIIDDINAELDRNNREIVLEKLSRSGCQTIFTATEQEAISDSWIDAMFHVEHGKLEVV